MTRDYIETFRAKLSAYGIKGKDLAVEAGRTAQNISETLNRKSSPSIESFNELIEAADRLCPGFADEYYLALAGHVDLNIMVRSLSSPELSVLLILAAQRVSELLLSRKQIVA